MARRRGGLHRRELSLDRAGWLMREAGFVASEEDPIVAYAKVNGAGEPKRVHAEYENGWRATLSIRRDGTGSLSMAIRLVTTVAEMGRAD